MVQSEHHANIKHYMARMADADANADDNNNSLLIYSLYIFRNQVIQPSLDSKHDPHY